MATQHTKQISIDDLVVGMYIVGLDQSWLQSPFLFHRRRIGRYEEIARLKAYGVRRVTIDPTRGLDLIETLPRPAEVKGEVPHAWERAYPNLLPERAGHHPSTPLWSTACLSSA